MINKVILIGHLGEDPKTHSGVGSGLVVTFSLATGKRWTDKATGEKRERTEWHRIVIYNEGLAKVAEQYLKKGARVYLEGELQTRKYNDSAGVARTITEVALPGYGAQLVLCDRAEGRAPAPAGAATGEGPKPGFDDEIPF